LSVFVLLVICPFDMFLTIIDVSDFEVKLAIKNIINCSNDHIK